MSINTQAHRYSRVLLTALIALSPAWGLAAEKPPLRPEVPIVMDPPPKSGGYLTFFLDNDLFAGTDANYTNGGRLSYITEGRPLINIPLVQKNLERLSAGGKSTSLLQRIWGFRNPEHVEYSYGFALTQLMFTPETFDTPSPPPGEHPYAGWLGIGFSLHTRDSRTLNSVEISFGIVGPHSYAHETQDFIHDLKNVEKFQGWDSQIPDEFTINIAFNQRRRWTALDDLGLPLGLQVDGFHETGYALGNYLTAAHVGFMMRLGWNLPIEFSDPRLTPTAHTQKLYSGQSTNERSWSLYVLAGARLNGILHDITLDGPVFRNFDTGVKREPWVAEIYAGFGIRYRGWEFGYVQTFRSKRFKSQDSPPSFGSLAIRRRF